MSFSCMKFSCHNILSCVKFLRKGCSHRFGLPYFHRAHLLYNPFQNILNDTDAVLYVDTDTIFLSPPEDFWTNFKNMNSTQLAALAAERPVYGGWYNDPEQKAPYYGKFGKCNMAFTVFTTVGSCLLPNTGIEICAVVGITNTFLSFCPLRW